MILAFHVSALCKLGVFEVPGWGPRPLCRHAYFIRGPPSV